MSGMATKPTDLPNWATDTNFSSGSAVGKPTKDEPSSGFQAQGWVPGNNFIGKIANWWFNLVYQWCAYVDDLEAQDFAWTGAHTFTQEIITDGDVTCDNVIADGDVTGADATFQNVEVGSPVAVQIAGTTGTIIAGGGISAGGGFGIPSAGAGENYNFTGTLPRLLASFTACGGQGSAAWVPDGTHRWAINNSAPATTDTWYREVQLPHGANVIGFEAWFAQAADTVSDTSVALVQVNRLTNVETPVADAVALTFGGAIALGSTWAGNHTVDNEHTYFLRVSACDAGGVSCSFYKAEIEYENPGPRNVGG
jgi:hypothetical protein